jgi:DNA-binding transcriptional LysR family regulator
LNTVNEALDLLEEGVKTVQNEYCHKQNVLTVGGSIDDYLTDRLKDFQVEHPEISLRQFTYSRIEIEDHLILQNLDFAICTHMLPNDFMQYEVLSSCPYVLLCHKENPLACRGSVFIEEAKDQSFICVNPALDRKYLEKMLNFAPHVTREIESSYVLTNILEVNAGIALVPLAHYLKIASRFPNHPFCVLRVKNEIPAAEIGVAYLKGRELSSGAKLFIDFLRRTEAEYLLDMERFLSGSAAGYDL